MSTNDSPFNTTNAPREIEHNIRIENPGHLQVSTSVSLPLPSNPGGPAYPVIGQPRTSANEPLSTGPYRPWEEGFRSRVAQMSRRPLIALPTDAQPEQLVHYSSLQPQTREVFPGDPFALNRADESPQPAPTIPGNLPQFPFPRERDGPSVSSRSEHTTPQHASANPPRRTQKKKTKEITLDDKDATAMVALGLFPFMVGQDTIANQNRFVRNECALARLFRQLKYDVSDANERHSKTERELRSHLEQQKSILDTFAKSFGPTTSALSNTASIDSQTRADPDLLELQKAHQEISERLDALTLRVTMFSRSTQQSLTDLVERLDQIIHSGTGYLGDPRPPPTNSLSQNLSSINHSDLKGKRSTSADSIMDSPTTMPPPTPDFRNHD